MPDPQSDTPETAPGPTPSVAEMRPSKPLNEEEEKQQEEMEAKQKEAVESGEATGGQKPTIGRIVLFRNPGLRIQANGADEVPAIITRVWSNGLVNLTAFLDNAPPGTSTFDRDWETTQCGR